MALSPDMLVAFAETIADQPLLLACALALATLVTEDGTLIAGSLMVGAGIAAAPVVITALALGIAAGDIGLYGLGALAQKSRFLRKRLPIRKVRRFRRWLDGKATPVLFVSRFLPGTRLPTYLTFGFLKMPLIHFSGVMAVAATVWVTVMVLFVSQIQQAAANIAPEVGLFAGLLVAVLAIILAHRFIRRSTLGTAIAAQTRPTQD